MIIEFFGPPGVGKTTVAAETARMLASAGVPVTVTLGQALEDVDGRELGRWEIWWRRVTGPLSRPRLAIAGFRHVVSREAASRIVGLCRRDQFIRRLARLPGVRLVDEGPLQSLCGLAAVCGTWPVDLLARVSPPRAAVLVTAEAKATLLRARARSRPVRFDQLPDGALQRELERHRGFAAAITERSPFPIIQIENQGDVDAVARGLARRIVGMGILARGGA